MVSVRMMGRMVPRLRVTYRPWSRRTPSTSMAQPALVRHFYRGPFGREPFTQMEEFMRDMERRFKRDVEDTMGSFFRNFPGRELPATGVVTRTAQPSFGEMENLSTPEKYKLNFYFPSTKPEDIKVNLKGRTLTISGQAVVETENSKSSHEMSMEYQLPEDVELEALESSLSNEGLLTVEAPRNPAASPEAPQAIPINRE